MKLVGIIISLLLLIGVGVFGFYKLTAIPQKKPVSSDWKTYTDTRYHFSIAYPKNWTISKTETPKDNEYKISFTHPNDVTDSFSPQLYIDIWDKTTIPSYPPNATVAGIKVYKRSEPTGMQMANETMEFKRGNTLYQVVLMYDDGKVPATKPNKYDKTAVAMYNKMISTLHFTQ